MDISKKLFNAAPIYRCAIKNPIDWYIFHPISFSGLDVTLHAISCTKHHKRGCHIFGCCWPFEAGFGLNDAECEKTGFTQLFICIYGSVTVKTHLKKHVLLENSRSFFVLYVRATSTLLKLHQQNIHQKIRSDSDYNSAYLHFI